MYSSLSNGWAYPPRSAICKQGWTINFTKINQSHIIKNQTWSDKSTWISLPSLILLRVHVSILVHPSWVVERQFLFSLPFQDLTKFQNTICTLKRPYAGWLSMAMKYTSQSARYNYSCMSNLIGQLLCNILPYCMGGYRTAQVLMDTSKYKEMFGE